MNTKSAFGKISFSDNIRPYSPIINDLMVGKVYDITKQDTISQFRFSGYLHSTFEGSIEVFVHELIKNEEKFPPLILINTEWEIEFVYIEDIEEDSLTTARTRVVHDKDVALEDVEVLSINSNFSYSLYDYYKAEREFKRLCKEALEPDSLETFKKWLNNTDWWYIEQCSSAFNEAFLIFQSIASLEKDVEFVKGYILAIVDFLIEHDYTTQNRQQILAEVNKHQLISEAINGQQ